MMIMTTGPAIILSILQQANNTEFYPLVRPSITALVSSIYITVSP